MRGKKDDRQEKNVDDAWADEAGKFADQVVDPSAEAGLGDVKKPMEQRSTKKDRKKKVGNVCVSVFKSMYCSPFR